MSLAYRQKLTSPKWNRFRGIRLRWKDKIRLNNVIWRCWHLQFIKKENTLICQFASPLDVDTHNKPEAIVLEGKYWKRKLAAVTAEYKKWRMFYRNNLHGLAHKEDMDMLNDVEAILADSNSMDNMSMMIDEDYMGLMSDTLFSTIANQPFVFPDTREIARAGLADFIQPSLGPLQPNLDDCMDTFDPIAEFPEILSKLPTVPEEHNQTNWDYPDIIHPADLSTQVPTPSSAVSHYHAQVQEMSPQEPQQNVLNTQYQNAVIMQSPEPFVHQQNYPTVSKNQNVSRPKFNHSHSLPSTSYVVQVPQGDQFRQSANQGYKFAAPGRPTIKFASQNVPQVQTQSQLMQPPMHVPQLPPSCHSSYVSVQKEEKIEPRTRGAPRGRGRSRSNTREPIKRPPLITAVSDPALISPQTNVLLTQLLTNSPLSEAVQVYNQRVKEESSPVPILPQPSSLPLRTLPSQITVTTVPLTNGDSHYISTFSNSNSPLDSPSQNLHSPTSSQSSIGSPGRESCGRDRKAGHLHAEQKRRGNIKNGFDMLHSLIPHLNQNPNAKLSKALMLQKGGDYIRQLRTERNTLREEMESLRQQIESLNASISNLFYSNCQSLLPATGAPVSRTRHSRMQEMFDKYVSDRTMENWKFWIFSLIFRPLLNSFNNFVSTSSLDDLYSSTMLWVEQHCTLGDLRPVVLNSLRYLSIKTQILSEPERLPDEARSFVLSEDKK